MIKKHKSGIIIAVSVLIFFVFIANLAFLPGPDSLFTISQFTYNGFSVLSILGLLFLPFGVIGLILSIFANKKMLFISLVSIVLAVVSFLNMTLIPDHLREFSREYTIRESIQLVNAFEGFCLENGEYPDSLTQLIPIHLEKEIRPKIIGIKRFHYQKKNDIYELSFSQNVVLGFNFEVVVYNPKGKQVGQGETPELRATSILNWKYYIYD